MSPFSVDWEPDALQALADLWLAAPDRRAVTDAEAQIDARLRQDPYRHGRHLREGLYRIDVPPLIATFTIESQQRRVIVQSIRRV
jgi:hypothetical protein